MIVSLTPTLSWREREMWSVLRATFIVSTNNRKRASRRSEKGLTQRVCNVQEVLGKLHWLMRVSFLMKPNKSKHEVDTAIVLVSLMLIGCASESPEPTKVDQVVVRKSDRKMELIQDGKVVREYQIALGDRPWGHKVERGDERTPEGDYVLDWRNPNSRFHKSIHVSYPKAQDIRFASSRGLDPGDMIMIHGQPKYIRSVKVKAEYQDRDWTDGCIAVQDQDMDEIWRSVRYGTPIKILP
jgi:murein L,D-transpeptidase YafK